jgi:hypothetical protein
MSAVASEKELIRRYKEASEAAYGEPDSSELAVFLQRALRALAKFYLAPASRNPSKAKAFAKEWHNVVRKASGDESAAAREAQVAVRQAREAEAASKRARGTTHEEQCQAAPTPGPRASAAHAQPPVAWRAAIVIDLTEDDVPAYSTAAHSPSSRDLNASHALAPARNLNRATSSSMVLQPRRAQPMPRAAQLAQTAGFPSKRRDFAAASSSAAIDLSQSPRQRVRLDQSGPSVPRGVGADGGLGGAEGGLGGAELRNDRPALGPLHHVTPAVAPLATNPSLQFFFGRFSDLPPPPPPASSPRSAAQPAGVPHAPASPALPELPPDAATCSICFELLYKPSRLPCGHHLCRLCTYEMIRSRKHSRCPMCRADLPAEPPGVDERLWCEIRHKFPEHARQRASQIEEALREFANGVAIQRARAELFKSMLDRRDLVRAWDRYDPLLKKELEERKQGELVLCNCAPQCVCVPEQVSTSPDPPYARAYLLLYPRAARHGALAFCPSPHVRSLAFWRLRPLCRCMDEP